MLSVFFGNDETNVTVSFIVTLRFATGSSSSARQIVSMQTLTAGESSYADHTPTRKLESVSGAQTLINFDVPIGSGSFANESMIWSVEGFFCFYHAENNSANVWGSSGYVSVDADIPPR